MSYKIDQFYDMLQQGGINMPTKEAFAKNMTDSKYRKTLYEGLQAKGFKQPEYNAYESFWSKNTKPTTEEDLAKTFVMSPEWQEDYARGKEVEKEIKAEDAKRKQMADSYNAYAKLEDSFAQYEQSQDMSDLFNVGQQEPIFGEDPKKYWRNRVAKRKEGEAQAKAKVDQEREELRQRMQLLKDNPDAYDELYGFKGFDVDKVNLDNLFTFDPTVDKRGNKHDNVFVKAFANQRIDAEDKARQLGMQADEIQDMLADPMALDKEMSKLKAELAELTKQRDAYGSQFAKEHPWQMMANLMGRDSFDNPYEVGMYGVDAMETQKQMNNVIARINMLTEAKNAFERGSWSGHGFWNNIKNIGKGMQQFATEINSYTDKYNIESGMALNNLANKIERGEMLTDEEMSWFVTAKLKEEGEKAASQGPTTGAVGYGAPASVEYMVTMALNPARGASKTISDKIIEAGVRRFGKSAFTKMMAKATGMLTEGAVLSTTLGVDNVASDALGRMAGKVGFDDSGNVAVADRVNPLKAMYQSTMASTIESAVEMMGVPIIGKATKGIGKVATKLADAMSYGKVSKLLSAMDKSQIVNWTKGMQKATGWHNLGEEWGEENVTMLTNAIIVGDNEIADMFDTRTQLEILGTCALISGVMSTANVAGFAGEFHKVNREYKKAKQEVLRQFSSDVWASLDNLITNAQDEDLTVRLADAMDGMAMNQEQRSAITNYLTALKRYQKFNELNDGGKFVIGGPQQAQATQSTSTYEIDSDITLKDEIGNPIDAHIIGRDANGNYMVESSQPINGKRVQPLSADQLDAMVIPNTPDGIQQSEVDGYNLTDVNQQAEVSMLADNARESVATLLGVTPDAVDATLQQVLGDNPTDAKIDARFGNNAQVVKDYMYNVAKTKGMSARLTDDIADATAESDRVIDAVDNNGNVVTAKDAEGNDVNVVSGNIVTYEDGLIDTNNSDASVVIRHADGITEMVAPTSLTEVVSIPTEQAKATQAQAIAQQKQQAFADAMSGALDYSQGQQYTMLNADGSTTDVAILADNGDGNVTVTARDGNKEGGVTDGKQIVLPKSQIQQGVREFKRNQLRAESAQETSIPQAEVQPTEVAEPIQEPTMPTDEQGNIMYEQMDADSAWDRLVAESGDDVDIATMVAQSNIEDAQKALDKAKKQTPKLVGTTEEKLAIAKAFKESVVKAQNDLAKWQEIADVPKRRASLQTEQTDLQTDLQTEPQGQQVADKLPASEEVGPTETTPVEEVAQIEESAPIEEQTKGNVSTMSQETDQVSDQVEEEKDVIEELRERNRVANERDQRAGRPPRPSDYIEAIGKGDDKAMKAWEGEFNDYAQKLNTDDLPDIESTIRQMQGHIDTIRSGNPKGYKDNSAYKAYSGIKKMLEKRRRELNKQSTENNTRLSARSNVGLVEDARTRTLGDKTRKMLDAMAKRLGLQVEFVDEIVTGKDEKGNNTYANADIVGNKVRIAWDKRDQALDFLLGHEFTHRMQALSPEAYAEFVEATKQALGEEEWNKRINRMKSLYKQHGIAISEQGIIDEVVADYAGELVEERGVFDNFVERNKNNRGLLSAIADVLRSIKEFFTLGKQRKIDNAIARLEALIESASEANLRGDDVVNDKHSLPTEDRFSIPVYHGSGVEFSEFDHTHMGEGEGNQAFGWGTYVTEVKGIAKMYAGANGATMLTYKGNELDTDGLLNQWRVIKDLYDDNKGRLREMRNRAERILSLVEEDNTEMKQLWQSVVDTLKQVRAGDLKVKPKRYIYNVEIPDNTGKNYLDYYEEMPKKAINEVRNKLESILAQGDYKGVEKDLKRELDSVFVDGLTASDVYGNVSAYLGGDKQASEFFNEMGYVGIKYPTNSMSGNKQSKDSNYVIFKESDAKIIGNTRFSLANLAEEEQRIVDEAKANGTYLKAPNGKASNLNERQWIQVRTKAFKDWFGDWELAFKQNFLLNGSPVSTLTGNEFQRVQGKTLTDQVEGYFDTIGNKATSPLFGDVILDRGGADDSLAHGMGRNKAIAYAAVKDVIENGVLIDYHTNHKGRGYDSAVISAPIEIGGERYLCYVTITRLGNSNRFYLHEVWTEKSLTNVGSNAVQRQPSHLQGSAKVLQNIITTKSEASKVVDENGEPKVVYHQTNKTIYRNVENGKLWDDLDWQEKQEWEERDDWNEYWVEEDFYEFSRTNARTTNEFDGFFFAPEYDEYHEYGDRTIEAFLNIRKPASQADYNIDAKYNDAGKKERIRLQEEGFDGVIRMEGNEVWEYVAFEPTQIKSATDNVGTFDANNPDIRYSLFGGNSGYVGYSMSKRAARAREEGRYPKTDFRKEYGVTAKSFDELVDAKIIASGEWHHTSKFGNETKFYHWDEDYYADIYEENKAVIDKLSRERKTDEIVSLFENHPLAHKAEYDNETERLVDDVNREYNDKIREVEKEKRDKERAYNSAVFDALGQLTNVVKANNGNLWFNASNGVGIQIDSAGNEVSMNYGGANGSKGALRYEARNELQTAIESVAKESNIESADATYYTDKVNQLEAERAERVAQLVEAREKEYTPKARYSLASDMARDEKMQSLLKNTPLWNDVAKTMSNADDYTIAVEVLNRLDEDAVNSAKEAIDNANGVFAKADATDVANRLERALQMMRNAEVSEGEANPIAEKEVVNVILNDTDEIRLPRNREEAYNFIPQGGAVFHNNDQNTDVRVSRHTIKHSTLHDNTDNYAIFAGIEKIVNEAIKIGDIPVAENEKGKTNSVGIYYIPINVNGSQYSARLVIKELINRDRVLDELSLYNVSMHKEKGSAIQLLNASNEVGSITAKPQSAYKVKDLIHNSQEQDKKLLGISNKTKFSLQGGRSIADKYEKRVNTKGKGGALHLSKFNFMEAWQDEMRALKEVQRIIEQEYGIVLESYEDAYMAENAMSSIAKASWDRYINEVYEPMMRIHDEWIRSGESNENINHYLIAKSGLERNREFTVRDAFRAERASMEEPIRDAYRSAINDLNEKYKPMELDLLDQYRSGAIDKDTYRNERKNLSDAKKAERKPIDDKYQLDMQDVHDKMTQVEEEYKAKRNALRDDLKAGNIGFAEFCRLSDDLALQYSGAEEIADYSGLTALAKIYGRDDFYNFAMGMVDAFERRHSDTDVMWEHINNNTKSAVDYSYKSGITSKQAKEHLDQMFLWYVPMKGNADVEAEDIYTYVNDKSSSFTPTVARAKGHTKYVSEDVMALIANTMQSAILQGERNKVKQKFLNMVQNYPTDLFSVDNGWVELQGNDWVEVFPDINENDTPEEVRSKIEDFQEKMQELANEGKAKRKSEALSLGVPFRATQNKSEHAISVMRNGEKMTIYVNGNPRVAQAINGKLKDTKESLGMRLWHTFTRWLSAGMTGYSIDFTGANLSRDTHHSSAIMFLKYGFKEQIRYILNGFADLPALIRGISGKSGNSKRDAYFQEFLANGGETGYANLRSLDDWKVENKRRIGRLRTMGGRAWGHTRNVLPYIAEAFGYINRLAETSSRFNAYVRARERNQDVATAVSEAKNITVNFNKKGSAKTAGAFGWLANLYRETMMFANPVIQGLYQFLKVGKEHKSRFTVLCLGHVALGGVVPILNQMLFELLGGDDEDEYYNQSEYQRRTNLLIYTGHGYIKIPLAPIFRELYALGDVFYGVIQKKIKMEDGAKDVVGLVRSMFSIEGQSAIDDDWSLVRFILPEQLSVVADISDNVNFMGMPIYKDSDYLRFEPEYKKVYKNAWTPFVGVSAKLNELLGGDEDSAPRGVNDKWLNPAIWQHVVSSLGGGPLKTIGDVLDITGRSGEDLSISNIPVAKRFFMKPDERTLINAVNNDYYKLKEDMAWVEDRVRKLNTKEYSGYAGAAEKLDFMYHSPDYLKYIIFKDGNKEIEELDKEIKTATDEDEIQNLKTMSAIKKDQLISEIEAVDRILKGGEQASEYDSLLSYHISKDIVKKMRKRLKEIQIKEVQNPGTLKAYKKTPEYDLYVDINKSVNAINRIDRDLKDETTYRTPAQTLRLQKRRKKNMDTLVELIKAYESIGEIKE